jgi:hypothetical protein
MVSRLAAPGACVLIRPRVSGCWVRFGGDQDVDCPDVGDRFGGYGEGVAGGTGCCARKRLFFRPQNLPTEGGVGVGAGVSAVAGERGRVTEFELIEPAGGSAVPPDAAGACWRAVPPEQL